MGAVRIVDKSDPRVWPLLVDGVTRQKYRALGHPWWIFDKIRENPRIFLVGVEENGFLKGIFVVEPQGKEEAMLMFVVSVGGVLARYKEEVRKLLKKLGIVKVYTLVWGDGGRSRAAEKLYGGKVAASLLEIPI